MSLILMNLKWRQNKTKQKKKKKINDLSFYDCYDYFEMKQIQIGNATGFSVGTLLIVIFKRAWIIVIISNWIL